MTARESARESRREISRLIGGSAFIFFCRLSGAAVTFFTQILLARWMGASELGIYVLAFSWCILLSTLSTGGFRIASIRFIGEGLANDDVDYIRGYTRRSSQITLGLSLLIPGIGAAGLWLVDTVAGFEYLTVYLLALLGVPCFALLNLYSGYANALSRFPLSFMPISLFRPLLFLLGIAAIWSASRSLDAGVAMAANLATLLVTALVTGVLIRRLLRARASSTKPRYDTRHWVVTAMPLLFVALFTGYFPALMVIFAGPFLSSEEIAIFHVCFRIAMLISFGLIAVDAFTGPQLVELLKGDRSEDLGRVVNRITKLRFWAALAAVTLLAIAGGPFLMLFGEEFSAGYPVLMILAVAQLIQAGAGPVTRLVSFSGHQNRSIPVFAAAIGAAVVLVALLAPPFGIIGTAIATVIVTGIWVTWMRRIVIGRLDIRPSIF